MENLLITDRAQKLLESFIKRPSIGVLIAGPAHMGKKLLARDIASSILGTDKIENYPYFYVASTEKDDNKNSISIEQIKNLQKNLLLKVASPNSVARIALIEEAHLLTPEASNALLKTLEEPPEKTVFILTSSSREKILPTILSRLSTITLEIPSLQKTINFLQQYEEQEVKKAYLRTGGATGSVVSALADASNEDSQAVELARKILTGSTYDRLLLVDQLSKDRELATDTLTALLQMLRTLLGRQPTSAKTKAVSQKIAAILTAEEQLGKHVNTKLALTNLLLSL